jgi:hypothetical protein
MAREILEACYHTLAFGTAEMAYELFHASWKTFRLDAFLGGLPGALPRWYGGVPGGVWVAITFAAATAAWIRSGARGLRALVHGGPRALDPMGAALAAGLAGTIALLLVAHRPYAPRYDLALAWLSLVPLVQVAAARGRWSAVLLAALLVAVPANAAIAARYYRRFVPPYAARTLVEVVDTIVARRRGEPFSLFYAAGDGIALTADRVARPRHGAAWRRTRTADVLYRPVAHGTWRGPKVRLLPVYRADLVEAPGRRSR